MEKRKIPASSIRLGVNIDHVATLRQARGGDMPSVITAARAVYQAAADSVTVHLREDRRHIQLFDVEQLMDEIPLPLNLEMAATSEMLKVACRLKPKFCCLVPEKRQELTTEGGLDVEGLFQKLLPYCQKLKDEGIQVALFLDPEREQVEAASRLAVSAIEFHTGTYANQSIGSDLGKECLQRLFTAAEYAHAMGLNIHAGHGLNYDNVQAIAQHMPHLQELNIGHSIIARSVFDGLYSAVTSMKLCIAR